MADAQAAVNAERPLFAFADEQTRNQALQLGMWVFLGSETLLFAGLFGLYASYRADFGPAFAQASQFNEEVIGSVNTFILIISSFFVAFAVHAMREGRRRATMLSLLLVVALGLAFLGLKGLEYADHLEQGIAPGAYYHFDKLKGAGAHMFFTLYYLMTALHALHVIAGLTLMVWLLLRVHAGKTTSQGHVELELGALYWHLIDIVWIFLWPLLYLT